MTLEECSEEYQRGYKAGYSSGYRCPAKTLNDLSKAVISVETGVCRNVADRYDEVDQFVCSECRIELQDWTRVERDEDDSEEYHYEYVLQYCPNCGRRIVRDTDCSWK